MIITYRYRRPRRAGRQGFSLVELLVAMALIIFIMAILSSAFAAASKAFRDLKAAGDLAEKLRSVMTMLRRDLMFEHFTGSTRLSSNTLWAPLQFPQPPVDGYFRIYQSSPLTNTVLPNPNSPPPLYQVPPANLLVPGEVASYTSTGTSLAFTARLPGTFPHQLFTAQLPTNDSPGPPGRVFNPTFLTPLQADARYIVSPYFNSTWAEMAYWLTPQLDGNNQPQRTISESTTDIPQPLFTLRRRQRLLWTASDIATPTTPTPTWSRRPLLPAETNPPDPNYGYTELSVPTPGSGTVEPSRSNQVPAPPYRFGMRIQSAPYPTSPAVAVVPLPVNDATWGRSYSGEFIGGGYPANRVDDIIATDVLSFDVRILLSEGTDFVHLDHPSVRRYSGWTQQTNSQYCNPSYRWDGATPYVFDTWCRATVGRYAYGGTTNRQYNWSVPSTYATIPLFRERNAAGQYVGDPIRIRALMITLRLWDPKTRLTRQMTIVQDM